MAEGSQNALLSNMERLITEKLDAFEHSQRAFTQEHISRLQTSLESHDTYTFRKKGNEEQHKVNARALEKMKEAENHLQDVVNVHQSEAAASAMDKVTQGIDILKYRQKLIRLADSSEAGWRVVHEYEAHPLATDEDDEKKIYRSQRDAERKLRQERRAKTQRYNPYSRYQGYGRFFQGSSSENREKAGPAAAWNQSNGSMGRKPGNCFRCGRPGHWRSECRANLQTDGGSMSRDAQSNPKISCFMSHFASQNAKCENDKNCISEIVTPVGMLKSRINHWKDAGATDYMLQVVENGYKLPFRNIPDSVFMKNNRSAMDDPIFVSKEIESLLEKGCISEVSEQPCVVNPLTVAYGKSGKARLVLDCRHINLELFKYKCRFEDQSVAKTMFEKGDYLFSFDIRSAYHHVMISPEHRTFLGFSWEVNGVLHFYIFNVLPFGISTAGFIFTKLLRVLVSKWRSLGYRLILFLDDGFAGDSTYEKALAMSNFVHNDLSDFGFIIAEDKCHWIPCQRLVWLGYFWDTLNGYVQVTDERISVTESLLQMFIDEIRQGKTIFPVRKVARLVGQLIAMTSAVGKIVRLRTRSLYDCVVSRASWEAPIAVSSRAFGEILFWKENLKILNKYVLKVAGSASIHDNDENVVFCDASGAGFAGFIEGDDNSHVIGCWSESEAGLSSTWRELEAVHRVINTSVKSLKGHDVVVNTDNKNVVSILKTGSRRQYLHDVAVDVHETCSQHNITILPKWVPRADNKEADFYSRCTDSDDWSVQSHVFQTLDHKWGPHTCDLFACNYNTKCQKFFSKYWCPGTSGINAFDHKWINEVFWLVPPPRLVVNCIKKIVSDKCTCTLVVPIWRSAPFWPILFPDGEKTISSAYEHFIFSPGKLTKRGRGKNGIFDGRNLGFGLIAIRFV